MREKGSRVTDTICLVRSRNAGLDVEPIFSLHIRYERHDSARVIKMPGTGRRMPSLFDDVAIVNRDYAERAFARISSHALVHPRQLFHRAQSNGRYASRSRYRRYTNNVTSRRNFVNNPWHVSHHSSLYADIDTGNNFCTTREIGFRNKNFSSTTVTSFI